MVDLSQIDARYSRKFLLNPIKCITGGATSLHLPRLHWCATPLAGIGATLAVTGAYVLASELKRSDNITAFAAYEAAMRPMVKQGQGVPKIAPRMMNPHSKLGINLLHGVLNVASKPGLRNIAAKLSAGEPDAPDLSRYDQMSCKSN